MSAPLPFKVRWDGERTWLEVTSDTGSGRLAVDREELRAAIDAKIRERFLSSWPDAEAKATARILTNASGLVYFDDHLRAALRVTINALIEAAAIKACDDWAGQIITVSGDLSICAQPLEKQRRIRREKLLKKIESAWRTLMDFTGKGGLYSDPETRKRYRDVSAYWQEQHDSFAGTEAAKRRHANRETKREYRIESGSTLKDWLRKAREAT